MYSLVMSPFSHAFVKAEIEVLTLFQVAQSLVFRW